MKFKILNLVLLIIFLVSCRDRSVREGQSQPLLSPSGNFSVEMPIMKSNQELDYPVWTPTIKDINGEIVYKDNSSTLSGYHNSYWDWSTDNNGNDILWIYNSDDGIIYIYYYYADSWEKEIYNTDNDELDPPEIIKKKIYK